MARLWSRVPTELRVQIGLKLKPGVKRSKVLDRLIGEAMKQIVYFTHAGTHVPMDTEFEWDDPKVTS